MLKNICLRLFEGLQDGKDVVEGVVDLLSDFGTRQHDLAAHEYEEHNTRLHHSEKTLL